MEELVISDYSQMSSLFLQLTTDVSWFENKEVKLSDSLGGFKIHKKSYRGFFQASKNRGPLSILHSLFSFLLEISNRKDQELNF